MASFSDFLLSKAVLEIHYNSGYLYWDKSGETILNIQKENPDWKWHSLGDKGMQMINEKRKIIAIYHWNRVWIRQINVENLNQFKINSDKITKILFNNFKIQELERIGNRYWFLLPCASVEIAEKIIDKGGILQIEPEKVSAFGKKIVNKDFTLVLEQDDITYRIAIGSASRPKVVEIGKDKAFRKFNPEHAILVDIDVFTTKVYKISDFVSSDFIQRSYKKIESNLLKLFK
ncbi:MAG: hypothetical protein HQ575_05245 [Candidatus Omnitrophica bacterium]|nr:hypothetical protein [Candidatus Omnitrophota bacterium]